MGLHPLVATLLVNMNFMVVRTDGNFCGGGGEREKGKLKGKHVGLKVNEQARPVPGICQTTSRTT